MNDDRKPRPSLADLGFYGPAECLGRDSNRWRPQPATRPAFSAVDYSALEIGALDAFLYRDHPVRVLAPSHAETSDALFHALSPGAEAVLIGGDETALRAAGFEILSCPVPEAVRVRKPPAPAAKEDP